MTKLELQSCTNYSVVEFADELHRKQLVALLCTYQMVAAKQEAAVFQSVVLASLEAS
jgi:hypothetical protein